jgi:hypothetical protein
VAKITELVDDFLPNENFYTFKLDENHDESREENEEQEIIRIVDDNLSNGAHVIANDGILTPVVQQENQKLIVDGIDALIKLCKKQIETFKSIDSNNESEAMMQQYHLI